MAFSLAAPFTEPELGLLQGQKGTAVGTGHRSVTLPPQSHVCTATRGQGSLDSGGSATPPPLDSDPCPQGEVNAGHQGIRRW